MDTLPAALWENYRETRDPKLCAVIAGNYQPLVSYVARMVATNIPYYVDRDDLVSYGNMGLLDAIERYDPARMVKFQTYAMTRIRGAVIDGLRSVDWVPRSVRARAREVDRVCQALEAELNRPPTVDELSAATSFTARELGLLAQESVSANFVPLDDVVQVSRDGDRVATAELVEDLRGEHPETAAIVGEMKGQLARGIGRLAEHLRIVVTLYHFEGINFSGIAQVLGVTESRVCQLYGQAMLALARLPG